MKIAMTTLTAEETTRLSYPAGVICQGFTQLGHEVLVHRSRAAAEHIFSSNTGINPRLDAYNTFSAVDDLNCCDLIIVDITFNRQLDLDLIKHLNKRIALIDNGDDAARRNCPAELVLFCSHLNKKTIKKINEKRFPLPFGISNELIEQSHSLTEEGLPKRKQIALNFTPSSNQSVRALMDLQLIPKLKQYFLIENKRLPTNDYLRSLASSSFAFAYGGDFIQDIYKNTYFKDILDASNWPEDNRFEKFDGESAIFRWDSWRFYESLVCGTLPIQLDFDEYGFNLPSPPEPWTHYIPINLKELDLFVVKLQFFSQELFQPTIESSKKLRQWAIKNFGPTGMADYILSKFVACSL